MSFASIKKILFLLITTTALLSSCQAKSPYQKVKWIYDGDTLLLQDGRKIRIIGINAPEVAHHKKKGEPYGREATERLREKLKHSNNLIRLEMGEELLDRYKRHLAHVFLADGTNISQWMLENGLATTMIFPPNIHYLDDYQHAEQLAQQDKLNIWKQKNFQVISSSQLKKSYKGYVRLKGRITHINTRKKTLLLQLDKKIFIKLGKRTIKYFTRYKPQQLLHKEIIVSGLLKSHRGKRIIKVRHPAQIDVLK
ncbi:MAG TPA: thermonuclease family protein [Leucothrix mucor]|nr:thermonuclease family protein [Leucothrix mucor]